MRSFPGWPLWSRFKGAMRARFNGVDPRVFVAFWIFGLINNVLYVIILTAALDLVGPAVPKATVLLASIIPGLATKVVVPYFIHLVPYSARVLILVTLSFCGMLTVALSPAAATSSSIAAKIAGIAMANISSGIGDIHFLGLTHYYGPFSLAAWGSGTGGAGLIGAGAYAFATNELGISPHATLMSSTLFPALMLYSYFFLLPRAILQRAKQSTAEYRPVHTDNDVSDDTRESSELLEQAEDALQSQTQPLVSSSNWLTRAASDLKTKLSRTRLLIIPYMLPLFLVYFAEYTINSGVAPTLLFPLEESPFDHYRAFYPTYNALYQTGVFISRSSLAFFHIRQLYLPTILQVINLAALIVQAIYPFLPTVYFVWAVVFWEGLLGGLVYVSAFARVREEVAAEECEFSLGAVTVSDASGVCLAGFVSVGLEMALCGYQVAHGRDWCRRL